MCRHYLRNRQPSRNPLIIASYLEERTTYVCGHHNPLWLKCVAVHGQLLEVVHAVEDALEGPPVLILIQNASVGEWGPDILARIRYESAGGGGDPYPSRSYRSSCGREILSGRRRDGQQDSHIVWKPSIYPSISDFAHEANGGYWSWCNSSTNAPSTIRIRFIGDLISKLP